MAENKLKYPFLDLSQVNASMMEQLAQIAADTVRGGRYIGGQQVEELEQRLSSLVGVRHAIGVSNGLDALRLILRSYVLLGRLHKGDMVIVPANTFIASALAITEAGLRPLVVDVDPDTYNIATEALSRVMRPEVKAIMPVHLYGRPCWDEELKNFAEHHKLLVIEDNAQAIGAKASVEGLNGSLVTGSLGHAAAFSFYPTKNIGALGDAGAVTTNDDALAATVRTLANYGSDRRYHNIYCGFNCRLDTLQAALLNYKLQYIDEENNYRRALAGIYQREVSNPLITLPQDVPGHVYHQFVVRTPFRDRLIELLDRNSIGWDIHYPVPVHQQPCYAGKIDVASSGAPVAEQLAQMIISLPITRCTSPSDARHIARVLNEFK